MGAQFRLEFDESTLARVDEQLARLSVFDRLQVFQSGLRKAGNKVAQRTRQVLPAEGYPGDKPGLKPLRKTIATRVRAYDKVTVVVVGPSYPAGAHGHLVEDGHKKVLWGKETSEMVSGKKYMTQAVEDTKSEVSSVVVETVKKAIDEAKS